jgi:peptide-methionine (S)-S-oxide reductase
MITRLVRNLVLAASLGVSLHSAAFAESRTVIVAGGCFWCVESDFDHVKGVTDAVSGYAGGDMDNPTYRNHGNHREVVQITYDPAIIDYKTLVSTFLRTIDPTDAGGQFCDRGHSYSTAIHAATPEEKAAAMAAITEAGAALGKAIATPVEGATKFWIAEDYHQNYAKSQEKQLTRFGYVTRAEAYKGYRKGCGRDERVKQIWGGQAYQGVDAHS